MPKIGEKSRKFATSRTSDRIVWKVFRHKVYVLNGPFPPVEFVQASGVGGEFKAQFIRVQRLVGAAVLLVVPFPAVLAVSQQRVAGGCELGPDLVGAPGDEVALQ